VEKLKATQPRDLLEPVRNDPGKLEKVSIRNDARPLAPEISWFELIKNGLFVELAQKVGSYFTGANMDNDKKATLVGFFTGLFGLLKLFGVSIDPAPWLLDALVYGGIMVLGYLTNKKSQ
jgi:uncharacterized membrane protein